MSSSRKLKIAVAVTATTFVTMAIAALPVASADDQCTVTVVLLDGQTLTFNETAPAGTPASQLVPAGVGPIKSVTANCVPTTTVTTPTVTTPTTPVTPTKTTSTTPASHSSTTSASSSKHKSHSGSSKSRSGSSPDQHHKQSVASAPTSGKKKASKKTPKPPATTTAGGVPTAANPTFSLSIPGPAPLGVPNFFIDAFQIPPFLLPIYQAAGIEYDVPWQVLAAINQIETDYGRNLSVSSAGAVGWMQFLPSTWKRYGVDATGSGYADPYNPVDAIFAAARYLHAAGASKNVADAIYSYNHAWWYVESVLLRAKLIGGMPKGLIGALTGLVEGHFPVAAPAKYADDDVTALAAKRVKGSNAAITIGSSGARYTNIFAKQGSPVIAVNDGKVVAIGRSKKLGRYLELQDSTGNVYTYADLGSVPATYPVPKTVKVTAAEIARQLSGPAPKTPATAGQQQGTRIVSVSKATKEAKSSRVSLPVTDTTPATAPPTQIPQPMVKERLFANPSRPASYAAGGKLQIASAGPAISNFQDYFSDVLHLGKSQYTLKPLRPGAIVVAGTILGRIGRGTRQLASHLQFMVRPAGKNSPYIDPKPILDGWKLLEATAVYRAAGQDPLVQKHASVGQVLLMSKEQLENRVLSDPHVQIYPCGRRDIEAGLIDRRVLAVIEFLSGSGLDPTVSGLDCGHSANGQTGVDPAGATGMSVDISKINGIPIKGNQGPGSVTDLTIRRLLTLQGFFRPAAIVSLMSYKNQPIAIRMPNHANRIQIAYTQLFGKNKQLAGEIKSLLQPQQWIQLISHIGQIPEPVVPIAPSQYAIKTSGGA